VSPSGAASCCLLLKVRAAAQRAARLGAPAAAALVTSSLVAASCSAGPAEHKAPLHVLQGPALTALFSVIRDKDSTSAVFARYAERLFSILVEETLSRLPGVEPMGVETPCGHFDGLSHHSVNDLAVVSIVRAGDSLMEAFRRVLPGVATGRILIQRDEKTKEKRPVQLYTKLPPNIVDKR
jgi:uracil phosphoribosyltransferase